MKFAESGVFIFHHFLVTTQQKLNEAEESLGLFIKHINHYLHRLRVAIAEARATET